MAVLLGVRVVLDRVSSDSQQTHHVHHRLEAAMASKGVGVGATTRACGARRGGEESEMRGVEGRWAGSVSAGAKSK